MNTLAITVLLVSSYAVYSMALFICIPGQCEIAKLLNRCPKLNETACVADGMHFVDYGGVCGCCKVCFTQLGKIQVTQTTSFYLTETNTDTYCR